MSGEFSALLDRHLRLSDRIRQSDAEKAQTEIERLVLDIDAALDSQAVIGPQARQMAAFAGQWRVYLATSKVNLTTPSPTTGDVEQLRLSTLLRSMSVKQCWLVGSALITLLVGAAALGQYAAGLSESQKLTTAQATATTEKARADVTVSQLDAANKRVEALTIQVDALAQERLLLSLVARTRDSNDRLGAASARKQLTTLLEQMRTTGRVLVWQTRGSQKIELKRTSEVWTVADN